MSSPSSHLNPANLQSHIAHNPPLVLPDATVMDAIAAMGETSSSCVLVVEGRSMHPQGSSLVGILTERDLVRISRQSTPLDQLPIQAVMSHPVITLPESALNDLGSVLNLFQQQRIRHLPVLDRGDRLVGMLTQATLIESLAQTVLQTSVIGTIVNVSDRQYATAQLEIQNSLLSNIAQDKPLADILNGLLEAVEARLSGAICSVLLMDADNRLRHGAAPSLPPDYIQTIDGVTIGEGVGSCGTAAFRHEIVIVTDIATDPLWQEYKEIALKYGLQACWSTPISASDGRILGTFAIYYAEARSPQPHELEIVAGIAHIVGIAIERGQAEVALRESESRWQFALEGAGDGLWDWDVRTDTVFFSRQWKAMLGYADHEIGNSLEDWDSRVHPDDKTQCYADLNKHFRGETPTYQNEHRVLCQDGSYKWILDRGQVIERTADGQPLRVIGTHTDITDRKLAEQQLQNLIQGTAATIGEDFFSALVSHMTEAVNVSHALVTEKIDDRLHVLAFWANGALMPNFSYDPAKTPCQSTLQDGKFYCASHVQERFPDDLDLVEMGGDSYLGIALRNDQNQAIGHLCILNQQPIPDPERAENLLQIFAARATAELERQRAIAELERLNQGLENKVGERTAELQKREKFLQTVLDTFHLSVFWKDRNSVYLGGNRNFLRDTGLASVLDLVGKTDYDLPWDKTDADAYRVDDREVMNNDQAKLGIIEPLIKANGQPIWLETNKLPLHDLTGEVIGILGTYQDVSDRQQAQQRLQQQSKQKQLLWSVTQSIRQSLDLSFILDTTVTEVRNILDVERVAIYRFNPDWSGNFIVESVADGWIELIESDVPQFWADTYLQETQGGRFTNNEITAVADIYKFGLHNCHIEILERLRVRAYAIVPIFRGELLWGLLAVYQNSAPRQWEAAEIELLQQIAGQLGIALQQTDLFQQLQQELRERQQADAKLTESNRQLAISNQELIRATRLKDEFLANMSHELRTPLTAILGLSETLQEEFLGAINERQKKAIATIERSGQHLLALINDILEVSKIEAGKLELEITTVSVTNLCTSSLALIKQQAFTKQIRLTTNLPPNLGNIDIDERRMRQVLINLLNNAVKFTPAGGQVTLEVTIEKAGFHPLPSTSTAETQSSERQEILDSHSWIVFSIADTGIGIAPENHSRLFQPFIQIDSSLNRQYQGTGLGLTLVKQIVELHGGFVRLSSELGQGSCFTVRIPYRYPVEDKTSLTAPPFPAVSQSQNPASPNAYVPVAEPAQVEHPLILLAEDNQDSIETLSTYLEAHEYRLIFAKNGQEAIALTQIHCPDLILMDIQMPEVDGLEAIQTIRQDLKLEQIPIVALTALAMAGDREKCLAVGANDYLTKPVQLKQLTATIQHLIAANQPDLDAIDNN